MKIRKGFARVDVDIGLVVAIEEDQAIRTGGLEPHGQTPEGGEERRQLHRDRNPNQPFSVRTSDSRCASISAGESQTPVNR